MRAVVFLSTIISFSAFANSFAIRCDDGSRLMLSEQTIIMQSETNFFTFDVTATDHKKRYLGERKVSGSFTHHLTVSKDVMANSSFRKYEVVMNWDNQIAHVQQNKCIAGE
ncbi:hypothetical protein [Vibrio cortegadensis]|uniref:C-type lysozyme inhibitor domain-containing protein n=1 Tax=Vibrio cortegadensis TaxID=1328770 RepID=A0ABV4M2J6_9VIBR